MATFAERTGTANPLNGVNVGIASHPTFADIDGDGDLDAFIGDRYGNINYFENDGSGNFTEVTGSGNPFDGVDVVFDAAPTFADIDGDGDLDAFIGSKNDFIKYFENDGSGNFTEVTGSGNPFDGVDVVFDAAPTFADIDGDGDLDAFIGGDYGNINYFENDGSGNFTEVTGSGKPFDGVDVGRDAAPTFADVDGDEDLDAFIGDGDGQINYFENDGSGSFSQVTGSGNPFDGVDVGNASDPTFADIDGDGDFDAFIGEGDGTINYFENITPTNNPPVAVDDTASTDEDSLFSGNVLTNDTDPENDTLTVTEVNGEAADVGTELTLTSGALLTVNSDGTFDYDPNGQFESLGAGESTTETFTYTIDDGNGETDTATATVTIDGVNDGPILAQEIDDQIISTNENLSFDTSVYFSDVDTNDTLTYSASNLPSGFSIDANTGIITGSSSSASITPITVTADDGNGGTISDTFELILANNQGTPNPDVIFMDMVSGNRINAKASDDVIFGSSANEKLGGSFGDDEIDGDGGRDILTGGFGDDTLTGGDGDDKLFGGFGKDVLRGGLGEDTIVGGFGQDTIVIASGEGMDTIRFFQHGVDKIGLADGLTYNDLSFSGNNIIETSTNEVLAKLPWFNTAHLDSSDFIAV
ncbi:MAG: hypothetical protein F6K25_18030 [Okeania sp. SIO2G4]|uniref:FG-GAP-like repeat-containing protein n=1 Tax=unclassified Okeania TaxID=2634635 RepID=UPI0013BB8E39|nr:hypothetical protein [Okeania sp. SIO2G5]NEP94783.1 hypothetical protein [Okeania sp. SIO2F5]NEQ92479.1 hypothetical protein [Okeania sp. SIO2G4]